MFLWMLTKLEASSFELQTSKKGLQKATNLLYVSLANMLVALPYHFEQYTSKCTLLMKKRQQTHTHPTSAAYKNCAVNGATPETEKNLSSRKTLVLVRTSIHTTQLSEKFHSPARMQWVVRLLDVSKPFHFALVMVGLLHVHSMAPYLQRTLAAKTIL